MRITISGKPGSGKSTIAKVIARKLSYKHYSVGDFMRELAEEKGITVLEFSKLAEKSTEIDKKLDEKQANLNKEDNFVIDSRLGFHFIKNSIKIFLDVSDEEAAKRIYKQKRKEEIENKTLKETLDNIKKREQSEILRYKKYYRLDCYDKKNYDFVLDTTKTDADGVVEAVIGFLRKNMNN